MEGIASQATGADVNLDDLSAKQKAKEFKATQKDLRSKDTVIKLSAAKKFKDARYVTEGYGLLPFFATIVPKKKTIPHVNEVLEFMTTFLCESFAQDSQLRTIVVGLSAVLDSEKSLAFLQGVLDALSYKEEVKPPKLSKKKQADYVPPPESPDVIKMRRLALKCLYYLIVSQSDGAIAPSEIQNALALLPGLGAKLCELVASLCMLLQGTGIGTLPHDKAQYIQDAYYAIQIAAFVFRYNPEASLLWAQQEVFVSQCSYLLGVPQVRMSWLQCLFFMAQTTDGLNGAALCLPHLVSELEEDGKMLFNVTAPPDPALQLGGKSGKLPPAKKDDKTAGKKGAKDVPATQVEEDPMAKLDMLPVDVKHGLITTTKVLISILTEVSMKRPESISPSLAVRIAQCVQRVVLNEAVWAQLRCRLYPLDEDLRRLLELGCILLGSLGQISRECRDELCRAGVACTLQTLCMRSKQACSSVPIPSETTNEQPAENTCGVTAVTPYNEEELLEATFSLRRYSEKAVLALIADPIEENSTCMNNRWLSCCTFEVSGSERVLIHGEAFVPLLGDMLDGCDVPSGPEPTASTEKEAKAVKSKATPAVLELSPKEFTAYEIDLGARAVRILFALIASCRNPVELVLTSRLAKLSLKLSNFFELAAQFAMLPARIGHALDPSPAVAFYSSIACMETFLLLGPEHLKTFAVRSRLNVIAQSLSAFGPDVVSLRDEIKVVLVDPRVYSWQLGSQGTTEEEHFIRPVLLDLMTQLVSADGRLRSYEENPTFPLAPCMVPPKSTSACDDCSLLAINVLSDALLRVLIVPCAFSVHKEGHLQVLPALSSSLEVEVRDAALRCLQGIGQSYSLGVTACVEALALSFSQSATQGTSAYPMLCALGVDAGSTSFSPWQRCQYFSDLTCEGLSFGDASALASSSALWPFFVVAAAVSVVLADPRVSSTSCALALGALTSWSRCDHFDWPSQPAIFDGFCASFLSVGGGCALAGLLGRFGQLDPTSKDSCRSTLEYLCARGTCRKAFWTQWAQDHKEEIAIDPKTGKPAVKKDDKAKKDSTAAKKTDPKAAPPTPSIVAEIVFNVESDERFPDPNRGPDSLLWSALLNRRFADCRLHCSAITVLIAVVQGQLSQSVPLLLSQGVDVNGTDDEGRTALMYALLLRDTSSVDLLLKHPDLNINAVDAFGAPTICFCFYSISVPDLDAAAPGPLADSAMALVVDKSQLGSQASDLWGLPMGLSQVLGAARVDVNVCDVDGNGPLLLALGQGQTMVVIGGYRLIVRPAAYHVAEYSPESVMQWCGVLLENSALVNACDVRGVTALHLASARGHLALLELLLGAGAQVNALDDIGRHALHFLFACCPEACVECFQLLSQHAVNLPLETMHFDECRRLRSAADKALAELNQFLDGLLPDSLEPTVLTQSRVLWPGLLSLPCLQSNTPLLFILLTGADIFSDEPLFVEAAHGDKVARLNVALHLLKCARDHDCLRLLCDAVDHDHMTALHALTVLCKGRTPQLALTEKEKRSKRVKKFPSCELEVIDWVLRNCTGPPPFSATCVRKVCGLSEWTPLQMAILHNNLDMVALCLTISTDIGSPVHFMAAIDRKAAVINEDVASAVVAVCREMENSRTLLNAESDNRGSDDQLSLCGAPVHLAVLSGQPKVLEALCSCLKVDVNQRHRRTQHSALALACLYGDLECVRSFQCAADRLDFAVSAPVAPPFHRRAGAPVDVTCVDVALQDRNTPLLQLLSQMRRNDVIEQLLTPKERESGVCCSWLLWLEKEHFAAVQSLSDIRRAVVGRRPAVDSGIAVEIQAEEEENVHPLAESHSGEIDGNIGDLNLDGEEVEDKELNYESHAVVTFSIKANNSDVDCEGGDACSLFHTTEDDEAFPDPTPIALGEQLPSNVLWVEMQGPVPTNEGLQSLCEDLQRKTELLSFVVALVNASGVVTLESHLDELYFANDFSTARSLAEWNCW